MTFDKTTATWQEKGVFSKSRLEWLGLTSTDKPMLVLRTFVDSSPDIAKMRIVQFRDGRWEDLKTSECAGEFMGGSGAALDSHDRLFLVYRCREDPYNPILYVTVRASRLQPHGWEQPTILFADAQPQSAFFQTFIVFTSNDVPLIGYSPVNYYDSVGNPVYLPFLARYVYE